jgi:hypothetical protein
MRSNQKLPWSVRQTLLIEFRAIIAQHLRSTAADRSEAELANDIVTSYQRVANGARKQVRDALLTAIPSDGTLRKHVEGWVEEMQALQGSRSAWLLDKISETASLSWQENQPVDTDGAISLPHEVRERFLTQLESLFSDKLSKFDDTPEPEEWAEVIDTELLRVGRSNEAFAVRVLTKRFEGKSKLTFLQFFEQNGPDTPAEIVQFIEKHLGIDWTKVDQNPAEGLEPRVVRPYSTTGTYLVGELVHHTKFGEGVVTHLGQHQVTIRFGSTERKLAAQ